MHLHHFKLIFPRFSGHTNYPQIVMLHENTGFQTKINDVIHRIFILIKLVQQTDIELTCYDTVCSIWRTWSTRLINIKEKLKAGDHEDGENDRKNAGAVQHSAHRSPFHGNRRRYTQRSADWCEKKSLMRKLFLSLISTSTKPLQI